LAPCAMRGVIWYQGESDVGRAEPYRRQLPLMVTEWRKAFGCDNLAFLAAQLPGIGKIREHPKSAYSEMRESIALLSKTLRHTATVAINDCGVEDQIHPPGKRAVGERLALAARVNVYGESIIWSGPVFRNVELKDGEAMVCFDHVGSGLVTKDGPLVGFTLAGSDQKFHKAVAAIHGDTVVLKCDAVTHPVAVRYAWADFPVANLWNKDGLPAGTFRSDNWPLLTQREMKTP
jgi:sialate O-acetylesterase